MISIIVRSPLLQDRWTLSHVGSTKDLLSAPIRGCATGTQLTRPSRGLVRNSLGVVNGLMVGDVGFLEGPPVDDRCEGDDVGRIDDVLVHPSADPLRW